MADKHCLSLIQRLMLLSPLPLCCHCPGGCVEMKYISSLDWCRRYMLHVCIPFIQLIRNVTQSLALNAMACRSPLAPKDKPPGAPNKIINHPISSQFPPNLCTDHGATTVFRVDNKHRHARRDAGQDSHRVSVHTYAA